MRTALSLGGLLLALVPASASGATFFVDDDSAGSACSAASPCPSINQAVGLGRMNAEADTIKIAPGEYTAEVALTDPKDDGLTLDGSGSGEDPGANTIIRGVNPLVMGNGIAAISNTGMTARRLRLITEGSIAGSVQANDSALEDVYATAASPQNSQIISIRKDDIRLERVTVRAVGGPTATTADGVYADGERLTVRDSNIAGGGGDGLLVAGSGDLQLVRSQVSVDPGGRIALRTQGTLTADSSLIIGGKEGLRYGGNLGPNGDAILRGVTIDAGQPGVVDPSVGEDSGFSVRAEDGAVRLDSSIALEGFISFGEEVRCSFSNVPNQQQAMHPLGGGPIACGHGAESGNFASPPSDLFVNAAGSDYRLKPGSPAYDHGAPRALEPGESPLDLAQAARIASAQPCAPRLDQGAYELQFAATCSSIQPDTLAPALTRASLSRKVFRVGSSRTPLVAAPRRRTRAGTTLRFTLSEGAQVRIAVEQRLRGRRVGRRCRPATRRLRKRRACVRYKRTGTLTRNLAAGRRSVAFSGRIGRRALRAGRYRFSITAKDAAGNSTAKPTRLSFRVVKR